MEPEGSLTGTLPHVSFLNHVNQVHSTQSCLSKIHPTVIHPHVLVFLVVSFLLDFPPITNMHFSSTHSCYTPCPSHPPSLNHSNYTWQRVQVYGVKIRTHDLSTYRFFKILFTYITLLSSQSQFHTTMFCLLCHRFSVITILGLRAVLVFIMFFYLCSTLHNFKW
jgi:hypothetical protein